VDLPDGGGRLRLQDVSLALTDSGLPLTGQVSIDEVEAVPILAGVGVVSPRLEGSLGGDLTVAGTLVPLALDVDFERLKVKDLEVGGGGREAEIIGLRRVVLQGSVGVGVAATEIRRLALSMRRNGVVGSLFISGTIPHGADLPVRARVQTARQGLDLAGLSPVAGQRAVGVAQARADLSGTFSALAIDGSLELVNAGAAGVRVDRLDAAFRMRGQVIDLTSLEATHGQSRVTLRSGHVRLGPGGVSVEATAALAPLELVDVVSLAALTGSAAGLRGRLEGEVRLGYHQRGNRVDAALSGQIAGLALGEAELGDGVLSAAYDTGEVRIERVHLEREGGSLDVSGRMSADRQLELSATLASYPIPQLREFAAALDGFAGTVTGELNLGGRVAEPRPSGHLALASTRFGGRDYPDSELDFEAQDRTLRISGRIGGDLLRLDEVILGLAEPWLPGFADLSVPSSQKMSCLRVCSPRIFMPWWAGPSLSRGT
jgi:hypothetical protein